MVTSPAYAQEEWLPLASASRGWEAAVNKGQVTAPAKRAIIHRGGGLVADTDSMAREAGAFKHEVREATAPGRSQPAIEPATASVSVSGAGSRTGAPKIKEVHAWGVEDAWGPKAGKWGQGAKAFKEGEGDDVTKE